jgi:flagellar biogenesis protein FliO
MPLISPFSILGPSLSPTAAAGQAGPDLTRYFLVCALLILGILGVGFLIRRLISQPLRKRAARRSLQVVDVLPLGGRQRLLVVRCYDRSFLLSQADREIRTIAELDAEDLEDPVSALEQLRAQPEDDFQETLLRERVRAPEQPPAPERRTLQGSGGILG